MTNRVTAGREFLEAAEPGLYARRVQEALLAGGVIHLAPDCMLLGVPCPDAPRTLRVTFQCSQLCALCRVLLALSDRFDRVRWVRGFRGDLREREQDIAAFARKMSLGYKVSKF